MSTIVFHRHLDPFVFYGVHIKVGGKQIDLGQNETQSISLPAGNYLITSGFRFLYQGKPVIINLSEDETLEFDVHMNVDFNNPMDSLNWSLRFRSLILVSSKSVNTLNPDEKIKFNSKLPKFYILLLSLISLLPVLYIVNIPIDARTYIFTLIIPILTAISYFAFTISRNQFSIMPFLSELFSAVFYLIIGIISHLYTLYFFTSILFVLSYFIKQYRQKLN